jgi:hypothetical protein
MKLVHPLNLAVLDEASPIQNRVDCTVEQG